jgi:dihydroflavonol-4-reductase
MKYLVTGATGLIGNNVVRHLLDTGVEVRALSRTGADCPPLRDLPIEVVEGDVRDAAAVNRAVQGADVVVHSAAHVQVGWTRPE